MSWFFHIFCGTGYEWQTLEVLSSRDLGGQVDDYGMPEAETKLQSPFSRSDTLEQVIFGWVVPPKVVNDVEIWVNQGRNSWISSCKGTFCVMFV